MNRYLRLNTLCRSMDRKLKCSFKTKSSHLSKSFQRYCSTSNWNKSSSHISVRKNESDSKKIRGMLDIDSLKKLVSEGSIETVYMCFTDHMGRQMGKRYDAEYFIESQGKGAACEYLMGVDMAFEIIPDMKFANWNTGFGDFDLIPDLSTLRVASWLDKTAIVICDIIDSKTHLPLSIAPRNILKRQLEKCNSMGYSCIAASELEYFMYNDSYKDAFKKEYKNLDNYGYYLGDYNMLQSTREEDFNSRVRRYLKNSGVPVEMTKGEYGLGQHELNVKFSDILTMADRHVIYKQCLKETAQSMGISVTFMAKPHSDQSGSGCHLHINLVDSDGKNMFYGNENLNGIKCSSVFKHFLGGWIKYCPELMVMYAPTINSYKRYMASSWAPTKLVWSRDNRTAGFRIVGSENNLRIECRIPGADVNPYLAFAASLASGLEGIKNRINPNYNGEGNAYAIEHAPTVPMSLKEAVELFQNSDFAKQAFGSDVVEHYAHYFRNECLKYEKEVTDWERKRYFEQI